MSTSSKPPSFTTSKQTRKIFTQKDEIDLLNSLEESVQTPILEGRFSQAQIRTKIRRLKKKYLEQSESGSSLRTGHDLMKYEISGQIWGPKRAALGPMKRRKKRVSKSQGKSSPNLNNFHFLMRQVSKESATNNKLYKQGLVGLGEDILRGLDKKWMELEMEQAAIQARTSAMVYDNLKSDLQARK